MSGAPKRHAAVCAWALIMRIRLACAAALLWGYLPAWMAARSAAAMEALRAPDPPLPVVPAALSPLTPSNCLVSGLGLGPRARAGRARPGASGLVAGCVAAAVVALHGRGVERGASWGTKRALWDARRESGHHATTLYAASWCGAGTAVPSMTLETPAGTNRVTAPGVRLECAGWRWELGGRRGIRATTLYAAWGPGFGARPGMGATTLYAARRWRFRGADAGFEQRRYTRLGGWVLEPDLRWAQRPYTRHGGGSWGADAAVEQRPYTRLGPGLGARLGVGATTLYAVWRRGFGGGRGSRATTLYAAWERGSEPDLGSAQRPYTRSDGGARG
jgi:hypothetical protein